MSLIKRRSFYKNVEKKIKKRTVNTKVKTSGWVLNNDFEYLVALQQFLIKVNHLGPKEITKRLGRGGVIKLVILSGIFIQDPESRVDLLVVGDHMKRGLVENAIRGIEAEIGKEIRYALFETPDFHYRLGLYDKLIRDILDFPHEKVLNKLGNI
jgi:hypothetical protein